jgi:hypothetical protein
MSWEIIQQNHGDLKIKIIKKKHIPITKVTEEVQEINGREKDISSDKNPDIKRKKVFNLQRINPVYRFLPEPAENRKVQIAFPNPSAKLMAKGKIFETWEKAWQRPMKKKVSDSKNVFLNTIKDLNAHKNDANSNAEATSSKVHEVEIEIEDAESEIENDDCWDEIGEIVAETFEERTGSLKILFNNQNLQIKSNLNTSRNPVEKKESPTDVIDLNEEDDAVKELYKNAEDNEIDEAYSPQKTISDKEEDSCTSHRPESQFNSNQFFEFQPINKITDNASDGKTNNMEGTEQIEIQQVAPSTVDSTLDNATMEFDQNDSATDENIFSSKSTSDKIEDFDTITTAESPKNLNQPQVNMEEAKQVNIQESDFQIVDTTLDITDPNRDEGVSEQLHKETEEFFSIISWPEYPLNSNQLHTFHPINKPSNKKSDDENNSENMEDVEQSEIQEVILQTVDSTLDKTHNGRKELDEKCVNDSGTDLTDFYPKSNSDKEEDFGIRHRAESAINSNLPLSNQTVEMTSKKTEMISTNASRNASISIYTEKIDKSSKNEIRMAKIKSSKKRLNNCKQATSIILISNVESKISAKNCSDALLIHEPVEGNYYYFLLLFELV